jgi:non-heme chloroperoxidase
LTVNLVADLAGPASGPPVLLLHGGGQTRHSWQSTAGRVAEAGFRTLSVDARGHGDSDWAADGDYSIDAFAGDLRAVATRLGRPVALVGASLGGLASLIAAGEEPAVDCSAVILVDVTPRVNEIGRGEILNFMRLSATGFRSLDEAAGAITRHLPGGSRSPSKDGLRRNLRRCDDGRYRWHWDPAMIQPTQMLRMQSTPERLEGAASKIAAPLLLVRGDRSELVQEEHVRAFQLAVPHAHYAEIPGAKHMMVGGRNSPFTETVLAFLRRQVRT